MTARTLYAQQVAHPAAGARPCVTAHGDQWRAWMVGMDMSLEFMNGTSIKRTARRLGKPTT